MYWFNVLILTWSSDYGKPGIIKTPTMNYYLLKYVYNLLLVEFSLVNKVATVQ